MTDIRDSDDLAANDARPAHKSTFDHALQPSPGDRPGEWQDEKEAGDVGQEARGQQECAAKAYPGKGWGKKQGQVRHGNVEES